MPYYPPAASGGTPAVVLGTAAAAGSAATFVRTDDTLLAFDATTPPTIAAAAAAGSATVAARRDHTHTIGTGIVTRTMLEATGKNWQFLGTATASAAVRTGTITWTGTFKQLHFEYFISGYSNTAIGRLIVGPTAGLSETGTTFCATHLVNAVSSTSVSIPGWPLYSNAVADNVPRWGWVDVQNIAAVVKRANGIGMNAGTVPTVAPTCYQFAGLFNDTTNLINKAELAVYDAITGAAISTRTFNSGTYLTVWGRNDD